MKNEKMAEARRYVCGRAEFEHLWATLDPFRLVVDDRELRNAWRAIARIDDEGVWLDRKRLGELTADMFPASFDWTPWQELDPAGGPRPSPLSTPLLRFPIVPNEFAAFLVDGVGKWLRWRLMGEPCDTAVTWGEWGEMPDQENLLLLGEAGFEIQQLIREAWLVMQDASASIGRWDGSRVETAFDKADAARERRRSAASAGEREQLDLAVREAEDVASAYQCEWRRAIVRHLLREGNSLSQVQQTAIGTGNWSLKDPQRADVLANCLIATLRAMAADGAAVPTARAVMEAWNRSRPSDVLEVIMGDCVKYIDAKGNTGTVSTEALQKRIGRLIDGR